MKAIALALSSIGVVVGALAVSAGTRRTRLELGTARIIPKQPPLPPVLRLPPPEPEQRGELAPSIPAHVVAPSDVIKPTLDMPQRSPKQAANDLYTYVSQMARDGRGAELGTASNPNANVLSAQMSMRGLKADGIYGNATRARGKELLGREFPAREPKRRAAPPPPDEPAKAVKARQLVEMGPALFDAAKSIPDTPAVPVRDVPALATPHAPPPPDQHVPEHSPIEAASALHLYINAPGADLGSKERPNDLIRGAQQDMGQVKADGIFGPKTRARMNALLPKGRKHG
jgi:hypothetical protein